MLGNPKNESKMQLLHTLFVIAGLIFCLWLLAPDWLSDRNRFLSSLMSHEILNVYGVLVAIALANAAQIHLTLNSLEERRGKTHFDPVRKELRDDAKLLVYSFLYAVIILIIKGMLHTEREIAAVNGILLLVLFIHLLVTWDLFISVMHISAFIRQGGVGKGGSRSSASEEQKGDGARQ